MKQFFTFLGIVAMGATAYGQADTDIVYIPDPKLRYALVYHNNGDIDTNSDRRISYREAIAFRGRLEIAGKGIKDATGIEAFVNITGLDISRNELTSIDVSKNTALTMLACFNNQLITLDVSGNTLLKSLQYSGIST